MTARWNAVLVLCAVTASAVAAGSDSPLRERLLAMPVGVDLGGPGSRPVNAADAFNFVLGTASPSTRANFKAGETVFAATWNDGKNEDGGFAGLGPLFNRAACFECHAFAGRGHAPEGHGPFESSLVRLSIMGTDEHGGPNPAPRYGIQLQDRAVTGFAPEGIAAVRWRELPQRYGDGKPYSLRTPTLNFPTLNLGQLPPDTMTSLRVAEQLAGVGLLEAVPDATLEALADPDDADGDGISGRVNRVWDAASGSTKIGRFGWKANAATLIQQVTTAAVTDMGITTSIMPDERCAPETTCIPVAARPEMDDHQLFVLMNYLRALNVPKRRDTDLAAVERGEEHFRAMGCAACHMPTLVTAAGGVLPELANQTIHPFTDLLLHDMGNELADQRPDYLALGTEWRTAPLWGIGLTARVSGATHFLHDGRARNLEEAILWHGGEAEAAKEAFRALPALERTELIVFLQSL